MVLLLQVTEEDFNKARQVVGPSALRDISAEVPNVRWEDIGGMESVKMRLKEMVEWPQKYAKRLEKLGAEVSACKSYLNFKPDFPPIGLFLKLD